MKHIRTNIAQYYAPDYELDVRPSNMDNANSREYLDKILVQVLENMRRTIHAPSTQGQVIPGASLGMDDEEEAALDDLDEEINTDKRGSQRKADQRIEKNGELSDSEDEDDENEPRSPHGPSRLPGRDMRRARMNYRNLLDVPDADSGIETGSGMETPQQGSSPPDDDLEMNLDGDATGNQTPSPVQGLNGSAAVSGPQSPLPATADDDDVDMGDAGAASVPPAPAPAANPEPTVTAGQITPPDSPPPQASAAATAPPTTNGAEPSTTAGPSTETQAILEQMDFDDKAIKAEEEGRMERELDTVVGEVRTEAVAKAEEL
jgi:histone deacetylase 1/2